VRTELEAKLQKMDKIKKLIIVSIWIVFAFWLGYPNGKILIVIGIIIMIFGFWFQWHYRWTIDGSEYIKEAYELLEAKVKSNQKNLTSYEIRRLSSKRLFSWIAPLHFKLGLVIIAIGFILLIM
jgi:predicted negative regulator of RcsB-dependent stress response